MVRRSLLVLLLGASLLAGCQRADEEEPIYPPAGAAPEAPPASLEQAPADEGRFSSIEEAQAALARAEQDLLTLGAPPASAGAAAPAPAPPAATAPAGGDRAAESRAEAAPESKDDKAAADRCAGICRAFGSLSRAADAICRLAGENDERCTRARSSVRSNFPRISVCRCSAP